MSRNIHTWLRDGSPKQGELCQWKCPRLQREFGMAWNELGWGRREAGMLLNSQALMV